MSPKVEPRGETKRYVESPAFRESLLPFAEFITSRHEAHGGVTEVRILSGPGMRRGVWNGYFDAAHVRELVNSILPLSGSPRSKIPFGGYPRITEGNVYVGLHAAHPDLIGRVDNRIQYAEQATSDADIAAYDLFPVDIDPERKSRISASDEEKRGALLVAEEIRDWFAEKGIKTISADSGNGYHLLVPTIPYKGNDLPRAAEDSKRLLHFLAEHFNSGQAKVDLTVFNPSRIMRFYGTLTMKGSNLAGKRPHRWSSVELKEIPEDIDLFGKLRGTLEEYKKEVQERQKPKPAPARDNAPASDDKRSWTRDEGLQVLEGILAASGLRFRKEDKGGRTLFIFEKCPHHTDDDGDVFECCVMVEADGRYSASCKHDADAHWKDFKAVIGWAQHKQGVLKSLGLWKDRSAQKEPEAPPVDADAEIEAFKEKWSKAEEGKERNVLLAETMGRITSCPVLERGRAMEKIEEITGHTRKLLGQVLAEEKKLAKEKKKESKRSSRPFADPDGSTAKGDDLPWICAEDGELKRVSPKAWSALRRANRPERFFRCGGILTRMEQDDGGVQVSREMGQDRLRHALARAAHFFIVKKKGEEENIIAVPPPLDIVRDMLAEPDPPLPILNRIVEFPLVFEDGNPQVRPGYHAPSRTFFAPAPGFFLPPVPERPTADDVKRALGFIDELISDFPFAGVSERAHAIALVILPPARELIDGPTPLNIVEAPSPGTGKGLLMDVLAYAVLGRWPAMMTEGESEDEWRKRITSKLLGLPSLIVIDNLRRRLDSAALSSALTASCWEDRILGQSKIARLPIRCVWMSSGNNPSLSHEMSRRTVRIRLDAKVDRPWLRQGFKHPDLRGWVKEQRPNLLWSTLTLIRAWFAAGRPLWQGPVLGMFDSWSKVMGGILEVAGVKGFLGNLSDLYEKSDAEGAVWRGLVLAWWDKFQDQEVGVSDLFELVNALDEPPELGKGSEKSQKTRLGRDMVKMRDRQFGDLRIVLAGERKRAKKWRLVSMPDPASSLAGQGEPPAMFTPGSPIGSPEKILKNKSYLNGGEHGEPLSNPYARGEGFFSQGEKKEKYIEGERGQTGSPGSPGNGFASKNKAQIDGEPQGEPLAQGSPGSPAYEQAELNPLEGSL